MYYVILALSFILVAAIIRGNMRRRKKGYVPPISPAKAHQLLLKHVRYYARLDRDEQAEFRIRAKEFLERVVISPVGKVKIFEKDPAYANVMGMVGDGAMHRMMVLSIGALRTGFEQQGMGNTGIHEFVHLLDKADGAVDGVPDEMMPADLAGPWVAYMHRAIREIRSGDSDINPYGATSEPEFFAVVSEYFFQHPEAMAEKHPELMAFLEQIYQEPPVAAQEQPA